MAVLRWFHGYSVVRLCLCFCGRETGIVHRSLSMVRAAHNVVVGGGDSGSFRPGQTFSPFSTSKHFRNIIIIFNQCTDLPFRWWYCCDGSGGDDGGSGDGDESLFAFILLVRVVHENVVPKEGEREVLLRTVGARWWSCQERPTPSAPSGGWKPRSSRGQPFHRNAAGAIPREHWETGSSWTMPALLRMHTLAGKKEWRQSSRMDDGTDGDNETQEKCFLESNVKCIFIGFARKVPKSSGLA